MNNNDDLKTKQVEKPFVRYLAKVIPLAFDESMSYYECLCALRAYISKTLIPTINDNSEQTNKIVDAFTELENYVNNYFDSLDVQTEVNNKLDQMAQDGTLDDIINKDLLGQINQDVENLSTEVSNLKQTVSQNKKDLENEITTLETNLTTEKYLIIGDSYGRGYAPDGNNDGWCQMLVEKLGLQTGDYTIVAVDGTSFAGNKTYLQELQAVMPSIKNKELYRYVILAGGYNDASNTSQNIQNGVKAFTDYINEQMPNAEIKIGQVGWCNNNANTRSLIYRNSQRGYSIFLNDTHKVSYLNGVEFSLMERGLFASDGIHPNSDGNHNIANNIFQALKNGRATYSDNDVVQITWRPEVKTHTGNIYEYKNPGSVTLYGTTIDVTFKSNVNLESNGGNVAGNNKLYLGNYDSKYMMNLDSHSTNLYCGGWVIDGAGHYHGGIFQLEFSDNNALNVYMFNVGTSGWEYTNVKQLQLFNFTTTYPTNYS